MKLQTLLFLCTFLPIFATAQKSQINFWKFNPEDVIITYRTYLDKEVIRESSVTIPKNSPNSFELDGESVYIIPDTFAQFPGGDLEALRFISKQLEWPNREICGNFRVYVCFIIQESGEITQIGLRRQGYYDFDINAIKVVSKMPNWIPAKVNGKNVSSLITLPIRFRLE